MSKTVTYDNTTFSGTPTDIAQQLREPPHFLSMTGIANLLGMTRANVSLLLQGSKVSGRRYDRITKETLMGLTDEEIMILMSGPSIWTAAYHRARLGLTKVSFVNVYQRRQLLIKQLFGEGHNEGPHFYNFFQNIINILETDDHKDLFNGYYYLGLKSYDRTRSLVCKTILKPKFTEKQWDTQWAIAEKVIVC